MKLHMVAVAFAVCLTLAFLPVASAQDGDEGAEKPAKPAKVSVVGTVSQTTDDDGNVAAITVTTDEEAVYFVVLDANGKNLGKEMNGKRADVTGTLNADEELVVESWKAAPKKEAEAENNEG